jgi:hypothetical protein
MSFPDGGHDLCEPGVLLERVGQGGKPPCEVRAGAGHAVRIAPRRKRRFFFHRLEDASLLEAGTLPNSPSLPPSCGPPGRRQAVCRR